MPLKCVIILHLLLLHKCNSTECNPSVWVNVISMFFRYLVLGIKDIIASTLCILKKYLYSLHCICNYSLHFALHQTFSAAVYYKKKQYYHAGCCQYNFVIMLLVLYMNVSALAAAESHVFHMRWGHGCSQW